MSTMQVKMIVQVQLVDVETGRPLFQGEASGIAARLAEAYRETRTRFPGEETAAGFERFMERCREVRVASPQGSVELPMWMRTDSRVTPDQMDDYVAAARAAQVQARVNELTDLATRGWAEEIVGVEVGGRDATQQTTTRSTPGSPYPEGIDSPGCGR